MWRPDIVLEPKQLVEYTIAGIQFHEDCSHPLPSFADDAAIGDRTIGQVLADLFLVRMGDLPNPKEALEALRQHPQAEVVLALLRDDWDRVLSLLMWLFRNLDETNPPFARFTEGLSAARELAAKHDLPLLAMAAERIEAVIQHEVQKHSVAAIARLEAVPVDAPGRMLVVDYLARIHFDFDRFEQAISIWKQAWPHWKGIGWYRRDSERQAGIAASHIQDHHLAAIWFQRAAETEAGLALPVSSASLRGEQALALWRGGEASAAIDTMADALDAIGVVDEHSDLQHRSAFKLLSHSVLWMHSITRHSQFYRMPGVTEPVPGRLSQTKLDETFLRLPLGGRAMSRRLLWLLAEDSDLDDVSTKLAHRWSDDTVLNAPDVSLAASRARRAIASGRPDIVERAAEVHNAFGLVAPDPASWEAGKREHLKGAVAAGILVHANNPRLVELLRTWLVALQNYDATSSDWTTQVTSLVEQPENRLAQLRTAKNQWTRSIVAALLASQVSTPEELVLVSCTLIDSFAQTMWQQTIEQELEDCFRSAWTTLMAERSFAFVAPAKTLPQLRQALEDRTEFGFRKCAQILLAALPAARVRVSDDFVLSLKAIIEAPRPSDIWTTASDEARKV